MMSLNLYSKSTAISQIVTTNNLPQEKVKRFLDKLDEYGNNRLYISTIRKFFKISQEESLSVIELLVTLDILKPVYKIKIDDRILSAEYDYLKDIPPFTFDEDKYEDVPINFIDNVFVFFRVISDE
ncbi:hypothetical protein [Enterococcus sp. 5H]|uniref:hypothetical protein n=1 Tax=Enterococcus sp. 5H TaxID=1229490 RepID=UPI002302A235|nr:hypothetical protein [Enterococcus sp. 5H]